MTTADIRTTTMSVVVDGDDVSHLKDFAYTSDVLQLGDPFSVVVPNPKGKWNKKLRVAARIDVFLQNPDIAKGAKTPKVFGVVTERKVTADANGTVINLTGADIGWHLVHNAAPVWFSLRGISWKRLAEAAIHPHRVFKNRKTRQPLQEDPGWGFVDVRFENATNRGKKIENKALDNRRAEVIAAANPAPTNKFVIQSEPGEQIADILITYAKKLNVLINVSADGYLQIFRPDYEQPTRYRLELHDAKTEESKRNNVEHVEFTESIENTFSEVRLYGERAFQAVRETAERPENPNVNKFSSRYPPENFASTLGFTHRFVGTDGNALGKTDTSQRARWKYERGLFDSWMYVATVKGHGQGGVWFESDTMIEINDTVNDVKGNYYVSSVQCSRSEQQGDRTVLTIRKPRLLGTE